MSECTDKQVGMMLYAYELGMLSDDDRQKVEQHLLDCDYCYEKSQELCESARLLKEDDVVREEVHRLAAGARTTAAGKMPEKRKITRLKPWHKLIPISAAAVIIFFFLVLKDWRVEIHPTQEAAAFENRLAVLPFENATGDEKYHRLGDIFAALLVTDLSVSEHIRMVPPQRINDILKNRSITGPEEKDPDAVIKIGREISARWILTGSILNATPQYLVTIQLFDINGAKVIASESFRGDPDTSVFTVVDSLSSYVKKELPAAEAMANESERGIASLTTTSAEAYGRYLDGIRDYDRFDFDAAVENFEKALAIDSSFAMVYYYLSLLGEPDLINEALKRLDRVTPVERAYILGRANALSGDYPQALEEINRVLEKYPDDRFALSIKGDYLSRMGENEKAIEAYRRAIDFDSTWKTVYNKLAYCYNNAGEFEQALKMSDRYIELAPGEANPYDSRGDIYADNGFFEQAAENYRKALGLNPGYNTSRLKLVKTFLIERDYDACRENIKPLLNSGEARLRAEGRTFTALIPVRRGEFELAVPLLDSLQSIDYDEHQNAAAIQKSWLKAHVYAETQRYDRALEELDNCIMLHAFVNPRDKLSYHHYYAQFLIAAGRTGEAETILANMERNLGESPYGKLGVAYIRGFLARSENKPEEAIEYFKEAAAVAPLYPVRYMLGRLYLETGRYDYAVSTFEKLLLDFDDKRLNWSIWDDKADYYLARAYEETDNYSEAARHYRVFLEIFKEADTDIPELADARERLQVLDRRP